MNKFNFTSLFTYIRHALVLRDSLKSDEKINVEAPPVIADPPIWLLQWNKLVSAVRANELVLQIVLVLLAAIVIVPFLYVLFKKVLWRVAKMLFRTEFTLFSNRNYLQLALPDTYSETTDILDWLEEFNLFCEANHLTNDKLKRRLFLSRMKPEVRELIKNTPSDGESFESTIRLVKTMFQSKKMTIAEHLNEYAAYKQDEYDNVKKYYTELCRLARLALPDVQKKAFEESVASKFLDGLYDTSLKDKLLMERKNLQKLDDIVSTAFDLEQKLSRPKVQAFRIDSTRAQESMKKFLGNCWNCDKPGHSSKFCRAPRRPRNIPVNGASNQNQISTSIASTPNVSSSPNNHARTMQIMQYTNLLPDGKTKLDEILVPVHINGKEIMFIVDTGATKSLINAIDLKDQINDGTVNVEPSNIQVLTATG